MGSLEVLSGLIKAVVEYDEERYEALFPAIKELYSLNDRNMFTKTVKAQKSSDGGTTTAPAQSTVELALQQRRITGTMGTLLEAVYQNKEYERELFACARFMYELVQTIPAVAAWMNRNTRNWHA